MVVGASIIVAFLIHHQFVGGFQKRHWAVAVYLITISVSSSKCTHERARIRIQ